MESLDGSTRTLRTLPNRLAREAELEELDEIKETIRETAQDLKKSQKELTQEAQSTISKLTLAPEDDAMKAWTTPPPETEASSGPSKGPSEDDPKNTQEEN